MLEAPFPLPGVISPSSPLLPSGQTPNLANSNGFEGTALDADGRTLHPVLEGPVEATTSTCAGVYSFDQRRHRDLGAGLPPHVVDDPSLLVADFTLLHKTHLRGAGARQLPGPRGAAQARLRRDAGGRRQRAQARGVDELAIPDPHGLSLPDDRGGDFGLGDPFSMPYVTIEAVLPIAGERLAIVNDTNFGSTGRHPTRPDDSDFIEVLVPGLRPWRR